MSWIVVALGAACMIALGILLLVWPHATLTLVAILIGCGLVVVGSGPALRGLYCPRRREAAGCAPPTS